MKSFKNTKKQDASNNNSTIENKSSISQKPKSSKQVESKVKCWNKKPSVNQNYGSHFQEEN